MKRTLAGFVLWRAAAEAAGNADIDRPALWLAVI
jgi:hypothetical protein